MFVNKLVSKHHTDSQTQRRHYETCGAGDDTCTTCRLISAAHRQSEHNYGPRKAPSHTGFLSPIIFHSRQICPHKNDGPTAFTTHSGHHKAQCPFAAVSDTSVSPLSSPNRHSRCFEPAVAWLYLRALPRPPYVAVSVSYPSFESA